MVLARVGDCDMKHIFFQVKVAAVIDTKPSLLSIGLCPSQIYIHPLRRDQEEVGSSSHSSVTG